MMRRGGPGRRSWRIGGAAMLVLLGTAAGRAGENAFGAYLSSLCVTCHQLTGQAAGAIPPIVGWPEEQFVAVMRSYRDGSRGNPAMRTVAAPLTDEEIAALAAYFGAQPLRPAIK